eukprot:ANDGO_08433.mRNA.1 25S rRNA (adenine(645)-N(1))-methyltransferase
MERMESITSVKLEFSKWSFHTDTYMCLHLTVSSSEGKQPDLEKFSFELGPDFTDDSVHIRTRILSWLSRRFHSFSDLWKVDVSEILIQHHVNEAMFVHWWSRCQAWDGARVCVVFSEAATQRSVFRRPAYLINSNSPRWTSLRDCQQGALVSIVQEFFSHGTRNPESMVMPIVSLPTGSGKSRVMFYAPFMLRVPGPCLIVTPNPAVSESVYADLQRESAAQGMEVSDDRFRPARVIQLSETVAAASRNSSELQDCDFIVGNIHRVTSDDSKKWVQRFGHVGLVCIDEAHHLNAQMWNDIEARCGELGIPVIALSATPFRCEDSKLVEIEDLVDRAKMVFTYELGNAVQNEYVKQIECIQISPEKAKFSKQTRSANNDDDDDDDDSDDDEIVFSRRQLQEHSHRAPFCKMFLESEEVRRAVVLAACEKLHELRSLAERVPHKALIFLPSGGPPMDEWVELVESWICEQGYSNLRVTGIDSSVSSSGERNLRLGRFEQDRYQVLLCKEMISEGYDHRYISVICVLERVNPTSGLRKFIQRVGRLLRRIPSLESADSSRRALHNTGYIIGHEFSNVKKGLKVMENSVTNWVTDTFDEVGNLVAALRGLKLVEASKTKVVSYSPKFHSENVKRVSLDGRDMRSSPLKPNAFRLLWFSSRFQNGDSRFPSDFSVALPDMIIPRLPERTVTQSWSATVGLLLDQLKGLLRSLSPAFFGVAAADVNGDSGLHVAYGRDTRTRFPVSQLTAESLGQWLLENVTDLRQVTVFVWHPQFTEVPERATSASSNPSADQQEFRNISNSWYALSSLELMERVLRDREEWIRYHELFRNLRQTWSSSIVPYRIIADEIFNSSVYQKARTSNPPVVYDFGCGPEFRLYREFQTRNMSIDYHGFDLIDIRPEFDVPPMVQFHLANVAESAGMPHETANFVVLSLSFICRDWRLMIQEAIRLLKVGGRLVVFDLQHLSGHIVEHLSALSEGSYCMEQHLSTVNHGEMFSSLSFWKASV